MQINSLLSGASAGGYFDYFSSGSPSKSMQSSSGTPSVEAPEKGGSVHAITPADFTSPTIGSPTAPAPSNFTGAVDRVSISSEAMAQYTGSSNYGGSYDSVPYDSVPYDSVSSSAPSPQSDYSTYSPVKSVMASNATASDVYTEAASGVIGEDVMATISSELALRLSAGGSRLGLTNPTDTERRPTTTDAYGANSMSSSKGYATEQTESFINTYA